MKGLLRSQLELGRKEHIRIYSGELLKINAHGKMTRSHFDDDKLYPGFPCTWMDWPDYQPVNLPYTDEPTYIADLKAVASCYGVYPEDIDALLADGVSVEEIEEYLYCG